MNSDISHASDCVFYDSELRSFRRSFDECYKILKDIQKRAERRQTVQISRSLFDYSERKTDFKCNPMKYFDFRMDDVRICLYFYKGFYSVLCLGFTYDKFFLRDDGFVGAGELYYKEKNIDSCIPHFRKVLLFFVQQYVSFFDDGEVIEF